MYVTKQSAYLILQFSSFNVAGDNFGEEKAIGKPDQYRADRTQVCVIHHT
jgi:hypothetical protein